MKFSKLSIPRIPVRRLRTSSIPRFGLHSFKRSASIPKRYFVREQIVRNAHFIPIGVAGKRQQRSVLRLPTEPPDALPPRQLRR